jgi:hypothetical protein
VGRPTRTRRHTHNPTTCICTPTKVARTASRLRHRPRAPSAALKERAGAAKRWQADDAAGLLALPEDALDQASLHSFPAHKPHKKHHFQHSTEESTSEISNRGSTSPGRSRLRTAGLDGDNGRAAWTASNRRPHSHQGMTLVRRLHALPRPTVEAYIRA